MEDSSVTFATVQLAWPEPAAWTVVRRPSSFVSTRKTRAPCLTKSLAAAAPIPAAAPVIRAVLFSNLCISRDPILIWEDDDVAKFLHTIVDMILESL